MLSSISRNPSIPPCLEARLLCTAFFIAQAAARGIGARSAEIPRFGIGGAREPGPAPPDAPGYIVYKESKPGGIAVKIEEHTQWVGAIVTNLQALETVLRYFLAKTRNEVVEFPKVGDKTVKLTYLTRHTSLGKLIRTFNEALAEEEKKFEVDIGVVHVRDAIAHGRLVTTKELPFRLWKFGPRKNGQVDIEFSEELTADWLKKTSAMIDGEKQKVLDYFAARGYQELK